jgi:hypothetical protein
MPKAKGFTSLYPNISRFVEENSRIEIGQHEMISAFVRTYDFGGTVYEGEDSYPTLGDTLQNLDAGIQAYIEENGIWED